MTPRLSLLFLSLLPLCMLHAEQGDSEKPIALEADRITVDDYKGEQLLEGNVVLTQGTLVIRSDQMRIVEDAYGFQHGTATGGPDGLARFRQRRDDGAWVEGEGVRIEYNTRTEIAELFQRARVKNGDDELRSNYIWYDRLTARYLAAPDKENAQIPGRVTVTILPRNQGKSPVAPPGDVPETPFPMDQDFPDRPQPRPPENK